MSDLQFYRASGRAPVGGLVVALVLTAIVACIAAAFYVILCGVVPFVSLSSLVCAGFGTIIGVVAGRSCILGHIRSRSTVLVVAAIGALVGLYAAWIIWLGFAVRIEGLTPLQLVQDPRLLWEIIRIVNQDGTWALSSQSNVAIKGAQLWGVWAAEVFCVLTLAIFTARHFTHRIYCEQCDTWCDSHPKAAAIPAGEDDQLLTAVRERRFGALFKLAAPESEVIADTHWQFGLDLCPKCAQTNTLNISRLDSTDNKYTKNTTPLVYQLMLTGAEAEELALQVEEWNNPKGEPEFFSEADS